MADVSWNYLAFVPCANKPYDISMAQRPRRLQKQITIRSNLAAALLKEMARDGRTKVSIIEDALEGLVAEANSAAT